MKFIKSSAAFLFTFILSFVTWIVLSGRFDSFHLVMGVISSLIVSFISADTLFPSPEIKRLPGCWLRFILYIPSLLWQIFLANLHMMYLVFHPRMKELINPEIIHFKSCLKSDFSNYIFANSITLTPGTITVYVSIYGDYTVHVIDKESGESLPGEMEKRVEEILEKGDNNG